jgi:ribonuclease HII
MTRIDPTRQSAVTVHREAAVAGRAALPTIAIETAVCQAMAVTLVAGVDEAGRGALAGPVVAAAVILPLADSACLERLNRVKDSKLLTSLRRENLFDLIIENVISYGIGQATAAEIDEVGILTANNRAMLRALDQLRPQPQHLLIDGPLYLRNTLLPQKPVVRGDSLSLSIAAASILAKVSRDRQMIALHEQYPVYGFARHKGYATRRHLDALSQYGPSPLHRHSFAPIRRRLITDY